jgi:hypothetical protein
LIGKIKYPKCYPQKTKKPFTKNKGQLIENKVELKGIVAE